MLSVTAPRVISADGHGCSSRVLCRRKFICYRVREVNGNNTRYFTFSVTRSTDFQVDFVNFRAVLVAVTSPESSLTGSLRMVPKLHLKSRGIWFRFPKRPSAATILHDWAISREQRTCNAVHFDRHVVALVDSYQSIRFAWLASM